jgi:hypothetical protein
MKISINDVELMTFSETKKSVIKNDIHADEFDSDIARRLKYVIEHKYEQCFMRLKKEWDPILVANGVKMVPTDQDEYASLVFAQPNYKDRKSRDIESKGI